MDDTVVVRPLEETFKRNHRSRTRETLELQVPAAEIARLFNVKPELRLWSISRVAGADTYLLTFGREYTA